MGIRQSIRENSAIGIAVAVLFVALSGGVMAYCYWPEKKPNLSQAFYSDDDGQTWFADSTYLVAPFPHNGKTAVVAEIYSYANGKKQFCAYLARFTPAAQQQLEQALATAKQESRPPGSVALYQDPKFTQRGVQVKLPGPNHQWIPYGDPRANEVFTIHSPDGTEVDQVYVY